MCCPLWSRLTNPAVFCAIWTHSVKVPSAQTPRYIFQSNGQQESTKSTGACWSFPTMCRRPMAPTALGETVWQNHQLPEGCALACWIFPSKSCRTVQIVLILLWNNLWTRIYIAGAIRFCCSKYQKISYGIMMEIAIWSQLIRFAFVVFTKISQPVCNSCKSSTKHHLVRARLRK